MFRNEAKFIKEMGWESLKEGVLKVLRRRRLSGSPEEEGGGRGRGLLRRRGGGCYSKLEEHQRTGTGTGTSQGKAELGRKIIT